MVGERLGRGGDMTDPALLASDPSRSAWVAANAGAGKTYTLAARVTRLLLAGSPPERILCLTYTKAAAAEMSTRLFDQLGEWAMLPDGALREKIAAIGGGAETAEDLRRARRLFASALETPGGLKIQTIHSFCQHVLMRFPLEAGVPASFAVLDERTARDLLADARAIVFERAGGSDPNLAAAIAYLVEHVSDMRVEQILDTALAADRMKLDAFFAAAGPEDGWPALLRAAHGAEPGDSEAGIYAEFSAATDGDEARFRETCSWLSGGSEANQKTAEALAAMLAEKNAKGRYEAARTALLTASGTVKKKLAVKRLAEARPDLLDFLARFGEGLAGYRERLNAIEAANLCQAALTVIAAVRDIYASEKHARGAIDYDDLIARTHALMQNGGAAWVLYKLDEGIDHILIDEAQDTSAAQWDIVENLTEEFFSGEGARAVHRTLFAVGDEKQSIFSFQGADPREFDRRRKFFMDRATAGGYAFSAVDLPVSRRSAPEILTFVDKVFEPEAAREGLTSDGRAVHHEPLAEHKRNLPGRVEFWPAVKPPDTPAPDPWNLRPLDLAGEDSPKVVLAKTVADRIAGWLEAGLRLPGAEAPVGPGDIMILLPRREPFGGEIIRRLKDRGVPVAGSDRLKLADEIGVMDLVSLGRFALTSEDDLALAEVLRSPLVGLSEEALFALAHGRAGSLWAALSVRRSEPDYAAAHAFLAEARDRADAVPPFEFYAEVLNEKRQAMLARLGPETSDAVEEFLSLALSYERASTPSLTGFLDWFEKGGAEVKRDMDRGRGEVRVMTVHGAKGLEADIVILPDTTTLPGLAASAGNLLYTDDGVLFPVSAASAPEKVAKAREATKAAMLRERRRLLYVALTRAKRRLYICGFENKRGTAEGSWYRLAEEAARSLSGDPKAEVLSFGAGDEIATSAVPAPPPETEIPDWAREPPPRESQKPRSIRPSEGLDDEEAEEEEKAKAPPSPNREAGRERGRMAHALLAYLPDLPAEAREEKARQFLAAKGVDDQTAKGLIVEVLAVLNAPLFSKVFAAGSYAEVSLGADLPDFRPVHGRIDRLVVAPDEVLIVDFKTGGAPPDGIEAVGRRYIEQMALYRLAAKKIFPGRRIACALLWTAAPRLIPLPEDFLDAETKRMRERLTRGETVPK
jgi:ATP-dependent helicase/nuclease subunit A